MKVISKPDFADRHILRENWHEAIMPVFGSVFWDIHTAW